MIDPAKGPYRAEFGAIHHEDAPGFLFTVTPDTAADAVAKALNTAQEAECAIRASPPDRALEDARLKGIGFIVDGRRVAPERVTVVHGTVGATAAARLNRLAQRQRLRLESEPSGDLALDIQELEAVIESLRGGA